MVEFPLPSARALVPSSLAAALAIVGIVAACHRATPASADPAGPQPGQVWLTTGQIRESNVVIEAVDEQNVDDTVLTAGKVAFDDSRLSHVFSPVAGRVTHIAAELGKRVKKGDALATIESPEVGIATSDVGKAEADLIAAQHDFERQRELFASHATSQRDVEQAEDSYRKAKAELARARGKARLLRTTVVDGAAQTFTLRAEIDGEIVARTVSPGMEVQGQYSGGAAQELFTIGEPDRVWILGDVFEMDLARVKVGSPATVRIMAYPGRVFEGKVDWVSQVLDPTTRAAKVRSTFDNPDGALKPEMYATMQIAVEQRKSLAVARSALVRMGEQIVAFVERGPLADGRVVFERVPVSVDEGEGGRWVPVLHGLNRGDRVVSSGAALLSGAL